MVGCLCFGFLVLFCFFVYFKSSDFLISEINYQDWNKYDLFMHDKQNSYRKTRNIRSCLSGVVFCKIGWGREKEGSRHKFDTDTTSTKKKKKENNSVF